MLQELQSSVWSVLDVEPEADVADEGQVLDEGRHGSQNERQEQVDVQAVTLTVKTSAKTTVARCQSGKGISPEVYPLIGSR